MRRLALQLQLASMSSMSVSSFGRKKPKGAAEAIVSTCVQVCLSERLHFVGQVATVNQARHIASLDGRPS